LRLGPEKVPRADEIRAPLVHARGFPLIEPSKMCPPEATWRGLETSSIVSEFA
jgi:hypothetical protein